MKNTLLLYTSDIPVRVNHIKIFSTSLRITCIYMFVCYVDHKYPCAFHKAGNKIRVKQKQKKHLLFMF